MAGLSELRLDSLSVVNWNRDKGNVWEKERRGSVDGMVQRGYDSDPYPACTFEKRERSVRKRIVVEWFGTMNSNRFSAISIFNCNETGRMECM